MSLTGGYFGIAVLEAPGSTQYWIAVDGTQLAATLGLGGLVTATVNNIAVQINQGEDSTEGNTPPAALDWASNISTDGGTTNGATVDPGATLPTPVTMPITFTSSLLQFSGAVSINLDDQVSGSANFVLKVTTVDVSFEGGGQTDLTNASLVQVALTNFQASGLGFVVNGGYIGIAVIEPSATTSHDTRSWLAVDGNSLYASINLGSAITVTSGSVDVKINQADDTTLGNPTPTALNWLTDISTDGGTTFGATVDPGRSWALTPRCLSRSTTKWR